MSAMNGILSHPKLEISVELKRPHGVVAGSRIDGLLWIESKDGKHLGLGSIGMELLGVEELVSKSTTVRSIFLHQELPFQGKGLPPSNICHPKPDHSLPKGFWLAREGKCSFPFSFRLPASSPTSVSLNKIASIRYNLSASVALAYKSERSTLISMNEVTVVEVLTLPTPPTTSGQYNGVQGAKEEADEEEEPWQGYGEELWEGKVGGGGPFGGREGGKVRLEAAITERCLVAGEKSCVVLRVTNDSQKKLSNPTLLLTRRLVLPHSDQSHPPDILISDPVMSLPFRDREFLPGTEIVFPIPFDVPTGFRSTRKGWRDDGKGGKRQGLFDVSFELGIKLSTGVLGKDLLINLPCFVAHPASLPAEFWTQNIAPDPVFDDVRLQPLPWSLHTQPQQQYYAPPPTHTSHRPASAASFHPHQAQPYHQYQQAPPSTQAPYLPAPSPYQLQPTSPSYAHPPSQQAWIQADPETLDNPQRSLYNQPPPQPPSTAMSYQQPNQPYHSPPTSPRPPTTYASQQPNIAPPPIPSFVIPQLTPANSEADRISQHLHQSSMQRGRSTSPARAPIDSHIFRHDLAPQPFVLDASIPLSYHSSPSYPIQPHPPSTIYPNPPGFLPYHQLPSQPLQQQQHSAPPAYSPSAGVLSPKAIFAKSYFEPINEDAPGEGGGTVRSVADLERMAEHFSPDPSLDEGAAMLPRLAKDKEDKEGRSRDETEQQRVVPTNPTVLDLFEKAEREKRERRESKRSSTIVQSDQVKVPSDEQPSFAPPSIPLDEPVVAQHPVSPPPTALDPPVSPLITPAPSKPASPEAKPPRAPDSSPPARPDALLAPIDNSTSSGPTAAPTSTRPTAEEQEKLRLALAETERLKKLKADRVGKWLGGWTTSAGREERAGRSRSRSRDRRAEAKVDETAAKVKQEPTPLEVSSSPTTAAVVEAPTVSSPFITIPPALEAAPKPPPSPTKKPAAARFAFTPSRTKTPPSPRPTSPLRPSSPFRAPSPASPRRVISPPPVIPTSRPPSANGVEREMARSGTVASVAKIWADHAERSFSPPPPTRAFSPTPRVLSPPPPSIRPTSRSTPANTTRPFASTSPHPRLTRPSATAPSPPKASPKSSATTSISISASSYSNLLSASRSSPSTSSSRAPVNPIKASPSSPFLNTSLSSPTLSSSATLARPSSSSPRARAFVPSSNRDAVAAPAGDASSRAGQGVGTPKAIAALRATYQSAAVASGEPAPAIKPDRMSRESVQKTTYKTLDKNFSAAKLAKLREQYGG